MLMAVATRPCGNCVRVVAQFHVTQRALTLGAARGQVVTETADDQRIQQQRKHHRRVKSRNLAQRRMPPGETQTDTRLPQAGQLQRHLQQRASQPAQCRRRDGLLRSRQAPGYAAGLKAGHQLQWRHKGQCDQHDTGIEDYAGEGRPNETPQGIERAGEEAEPAEKDERRRRQPQQRRRQCKGLRFQPAAAEEQRHLRRKQFQQQHQQCQQHRGHAQQGREEAPQFALAIALRHLAQHGDDGAVDVAGDEQVVERARRDDGHVEGIDGGRGAEEVGQYDLARQAQHAAGDVAQRQQAGGARHPELGLFLGFAGCGWLRRSRMGGQTRGSVLAGVYPGAGVV